LESKITPDLNLVGLPGLREALRLGDLQMVRTLIETGVDIHYKMEDGSDALMDAVFGLCAKDSRQLDLLRLLIKQGVDLSGISVYRQSGLRVLSDSGRFDAVGLLLEAGADRDHLDWTPLHEAVSLGSVTDVEKAIAAGADLEARDYWERTPFHIALLLGDLSKVELLCDSGVNTQACGRSGNPPIFYAIEGRHPSVLRWLIQHWADVNQTGDSGNSALTEAVRRDDRESVELLLATGADIELRPTRNHLLHLEEVTGHRFPDGLIANWKGASPLMEARSKGIILRLLSAGANPADVGCDGQRILIGLPELGDRDVLHGLSAAEYERAYTPRFGKANPERMQEPVWEMLVRAGIGAEKARERFGSSEPLPAPGWCAERFGQSLTFLPDGRAIQVAGEHGDHYEPDFWIYNDVFVHGPDGSLAIYGYPEEIFPPTDFHTATLFGEFIYLIGSAGYRGTRRYGETPVYRLDTRTLQMNQIVTTGYLPGWISGHRAEAVNPHTIRLWSGNVTIHHSGEERHEPNLDTFDLDLNTLHWNRLVRPSPPLPKDVRELPGQVQGDSPRVQLG
jgi:ankyrin repeat protein